MPKLLVHALERRSEEPLVLAAEETERFEPVADLLRQRGRSVECRPFSWAETLDDPAIAGKRLILCALPETAEHWSAIAALKTRFGGNLTLLSELLLPYTRISFLQGRLNYDRSELSTILPFYFGEKKFGPLGKLDELLPLRGLSILEFGPFDGCQTAGLVHLGAGSVTCIEARAENATKTAAAIEVMGWTHVRLIMDDFHNADAAKYGRFDLAFAHGVYYHSIAPFVFLENLRTLSDRIFIGGFCGTDDLPNSPWRELTYEGRSYRVKEYHEKNIYSAGINKVAYFFHADDLMRFYSERDYRIEMVSDEAKEVTAGRFVRFLATNHK
jgi:hypothetical protein